MSGYRDELIERAEKYLENTRMAIDLHKREGRPAHELVQLAAQIESVLLDLRGGKVGEIERLKDALQSVVDRRFNSGLSEGQRAALMAQTAVDALNPTTTGEQS